MDDGSSSANQQQQRMNTQILMEEDDTIQQLQERERSIRQLEVINSFHHVSVSNLYGLCFFIHLLLSGMNNIISSQFFVVGYC